MKNIIKNLEHSKIVNLENEVEYMPGQIVSKTLSQNEFNSLTLFAFEKGEEISSHKSNGDAMVIALDGVGEITIGENNYILQKGESIVMPATISHAIYAKEKFKMFLIVIFPKKI